MVLVIRLISLLGLFLGQLVLLPLLSHQVGLLFQVCVLFVCLLIFCVLADTISFILFGRVFLWDV